MNHDRRTDASAFASTETMWRIATSNLARGIALCPSGVNAPQHAKDLVKESCESLRSLFPERSALLAELLGERLFMALEEGKVQAGELLLHAGANVNWADETGATALDIAVKAGRFEVITLLLQSGATEGVKPNAEVSEQVPHSQKIWALTELVRTRQINSVVHLLSAEKFKPADLGEPLMKAVEHANVRMISALIDAGADVHAKGGPNSLSALDVAMMEDSPMRFNPEVQAMVRSVLTEASIARAVGNVRPQSPAPASAHKPGPLQNLGAVETTLPAPAGDVVAQGRRKPSSPSPM